MMLHNTDELQSWRQALLPLFPQRIKEALCGVSDDRADRIEEIRVRVNSPVQIIERGAQYLLSQPASVSAAECGHIMGMLSHRSLYAFDEELCRGCITLCGGYRVGLGGKLVPSGGGAYRLSACTYFNFRIARQITGCSDAVMPYILNNNSNGYKVNSTLVLSPPGCGKTTLLRDISRSLSSGGIKVCVIDERSELAGCWEGVPMCDVGIRADVIDGCPKTTAIELALRSLSPQALITDEVASMRDVQSLLMAQGGGVALIASAHAAGIEDVEKRPVLAALHRAGCFDRYVLLPGGGARRIKVYDGELRLIGGDGGEIDGVGAGHGSLRVVGLQKCL